ncbi:hypothetical protein [Oceanobacillus sp. CAU 1775]
MFQDNNSFYKFFKPIGIATTGEHYLKSKKKENLIGVVFANDSKDFGDEFAVAVGKARFWDRE